MKTTKCQTIFSTERKIILRDAVFCSFFFAKSKGQIASGFYSFFYSTINLYFHSEFQGMVLPHNAVLVLHSGLIKLAANDKSFPRIFESQYSLLSTLLFQHPEAVYGAVHVFITCVRSIL